MANKPVARDAASGHEETYDEWFVRQMKESLAEADDPDTVWVPHEEVMRDWEEQRKEILTMIAKK